MSTPFSKFLEKNFLMAGSCSEYWV